MNVLAMNFPIAALPPILGDYLQYWIAGAIVVLGLLVYGRRDVAVFSASRTWAISSVCFAESIRKRVLWITPLAILGVVIVSQFQRPMDEADAVRQMLNVCLFATGVVVTITAIILACTNLPKEIENRVIFTIVTKPTTRLEIVLGKIVGFARVAAAILIIMGLFTFGYLWLNASGMQRSINERLRSQQVEASVRPTLEYYHDYGLLNARRLGMPETLQISAREPAGTDDLWMLGAEGDVLVPFHLSPDDLIPPGSTDGKPLSAGIALRLQIGFDEIFVTAVPNATTLPAGIAAPNVTPEQSRVNPGVNVSIVDRQTDTLVPSASFNHGQPTMLADADGQRAVIIPSTSEALPGVDRWSDVFVNITGTVPEAMYKFSPDSVKLIIPSVSANVEPRMIEPPPIERWSFRGRYGRSGFQVRGGTPGEQASHVALFSFKDTFVTAEPGTDRAAFEFRSDIERSGTDDSEEALTKLQVIVHNQSLGRDSPPIVFPLEANRPIFFKIPVEYLQGGNFVVQARCITPGHYLGVSRNSLSVVQSNQGFVLNLMKSLFIMWLMTILVVSVAVFCSTFLSWPIAIVLTVVLLLGRWGVEQLGDALQPGIGNTVATDLGFALRPEVSATVSKSVEALAAFLRVSARVMPDISQFAAIEDLKNGVAVPAGKLGDAALVLLTFALPVSVLAYVVLRNKEVAP